MCMIHGWHWELGCMVSYLKQFQTTSHHKIKMPKCGRLSMFGEGVRWIISSRENVDAQSSSGHTTEYTSECQEDISSSLSFHFPVTKSPPLSEQSSL